MARNYPQEYLAEKNKLRSSGAWAHLYTITLNRGNSIYRLTSNPEPITYDGEVYESAGISHGEIETNKSPDVTGTSVSINNIDRKAEAILVHHGGLRGSKVTITKVNTGLLEHIVPSRVYQVRSAASDEREVSLRLQGTPLFDRTFPKDTYSRTSCRSVFKSARCGWFNVPAGATSDFCDHTEHGARGCAYHGQLHEDAGIPRKHPERFKAWNKIPKRAGP